MKNIVKIVLLSVVVVGFGLLGGNAVGGSVALENENISWEKNDLVTRVTMTQNGVDYFEIDRSELPLIVRSAVAGKYAAYRIEKVYLNPDMNYKLLISNGETKLTVIYNESGEYLRGETNSVWKNVILG